MKDTKFHVGCSAFATSSWKGLFYPEGLAKSKWFDYYCQHFDTYEFNGSFYKFPTVKNLLDWYDKTPQNFQFSIKIPKTITHLKKLKNCKTETDEFYSVVNEGLKEKLACVLWQFPPGFHFDDEKLAAIIQLQNPGFKNVIEFRHESWWREDVLAELSKNKITFCNVNYPKLPETIQYNSKTGYLRMHGNPTLFYSQYSETELERIYNEISTLGFEEIYVYFNNTASAAGIINAIQFKSLIK